MMKFKSGDKVEVTKEFVHQGYGQFKTLFVGQVGILQVKVTGILNDSWTVIVDGMLFGIQVPESYFSHVNVTKVPVSVKIVEGVTTDDSSVMILAYNEHGEPITIRIPEDLFDLAEYKFNSKEKEL